MGMIRWKMRARAIGFGLLAFSGAAQADDIANFYAGKQVSIIIGSEPGGTYDLYGRTIARHLGRFIPGEPRIIAQNLPGAGGHATARRVYSIAPQDGTAIGSIGAALPYQPLIDPNSPPLDVAKINWLPSISGYNMVMLVRADVPVKSISDLRTRETVQATIAPGQGNSLIVAAVNEALRTKIKGVNGHKGLGESMLALQRGEIEGYPSMPVEMLTRNYAQLLAEGKVRLLLQFGAAALPEYPDVPYAADLAEKPEDRMLIDLATAFLKTGYVYMLGPDVPKERVAALRKAFMAVFKDPDFLAEAKAQTLSVNPIEAEKIQEMIAQTYALPQPIIDRMRAFYRGG